MSGTRYANALLNPQTDPGQPQLTAQQRAAYMRSLMSPPLDIGPRWNTPEENAQASADLANLRKLWGPSLPTRENQPGPDPNLAKGPLQRLHWPTPEEVKQALRTLPPMFLGSTSPIGLAPKFGVMDFPKGLSASFVSPNVERLDFKGALSGLQSKRQQLLTSAARDIHENMGVDATHTPGIGAWKDGAEPTVMTTSHGMDEDQLDTTASMLGHLANQKQVLTFHEHPEGTSFLHHFDATGDLEDIHNNLLDDGIAYHTLIPTPTGATVYAADFGGDMEPAIEQAAARYGQKPKFYRGTVKLLGAEDQPGGDADTRAESLKEYSRIIAGSRVQDAPVLWQELRDTYERALKAPEGVDSPELAPAER